MSSTDHDVDHALAYPEPPASPLWHRHGAVKTRPLTDAEKQRNRELLAQVPHHHRRVEEPPCSPT